MDRIKDAGRPLTITLRRVPWTNPTAGHHNNIASVVLPSPTVETQHSSQKQDVEVSSAVTPALGDAEMILELQKDNTQLREALRRSEDEKQVGVNLVISIS